MSENAWKVGEKGTHDAYLEEFTVLAVDGSYLAVSSAYTRFWVHYAQLNRIRTHEQIAAEEREAIVKEMLMDAGVTGSAFDGDPEAEVWAAALHDAGYRKQGEAK